ncbi:MAG: L-rhamnose isomerase [Victivallaceae bacterium]
MTFKNAVEQYEVWGVDVEKALERLSQIAVSMHCWQGDDVAGFENAGTLDGGLAVTGNYPGRARNGDELRADLDFAMSLIPGKKRLNLHAIYAENSSRKVSRNELDIESFARFIDWAAERGIGLDFNPSYFAHPLARGGFTLSSPDAKIRRFWIEHGIACRKIAEEFGRRLGSASIVNFWIPDGYKDLPADRTAPRERLVASLDEIFQVPIDQTLSRDAVECKLFGIGSESYVTGSHEFYMGYAMSRGKMLCLDAGHFHPTEAIADKLSSILLFSPEVLLHVSRGVRWDSDHVVLFNDELRAIAEEVVRCGENRIHIALDYFDASINRIAAWTIGMRATQKALLAALLEPSASLRDAETNGNYTRRLVMLEESKTLPLGTIWEEYCRRQHIPAGVEWLDAVLNYENEVLAKRS